MVVCLALVLVASAAAQFGSLPHAVAKTGASPERPSDPLDTALPTLTETLLPLAGASVKDRTWRLVVLCSGGLDLAPLVVHRDPDDLRDRWRQPNPKPPPRRREAFHPACRAYWTDVVCTTCGAAA